MTILPWRFRIPLVGVLLVAGCGTTGSSGGNPVESALPTITAIEPSDAGPGDRITIRGRDFAGEGIAVLFGGVTARVVDATPTALLVIVPDVPQGDHLVVVTVAGATSRPFRYGVGPVLLPAILAIEPTAAHVLDEITITGRNFRIGSQSANLTVLVGGVATGVSGTATSSRLVVKVPIVSRGSTTIQVRSGARSSEAVPFEVLHSSPVVTAVSPNPARTGLLVTIEGRHLAGFGAAVVVDGTPAVTRPLGNNTQIVAMVPPLAVGAHSLQVRIEGEASPPVPLVVDDFDVTGTYEVRSEVLASRSDVAACPDPGTVREYPIELLDMRPDLTLRIGLGAPVLHGSVDSAGSMFLRSAFTCNPLLCGFDSSYQVSGRVHRRELDARYGIDATIIRADACSLREHVTGLRR